MTTSVHTEQRALTAIAPWFCNSDYLIPTKLVVFYIFLGLTGCNLYPRMVLEEKTDTATHLMARFLKSNNPYNYTELEHLLTEEFGAKPPLQFNNYINSIGGSCEHLQDNSSVCTYNHNTSVMLHKPWGWDSPSSSAKGTATKIITMTTLNEKIGMDLRIKFFKVSITQTAALK